MTQWSVYSRKQWVHAVNLSALSAWALISFPLTAATGLSMLGYAAIFGLPTSFICCWLVGAPILKRIMRKPISAPKAAATGSGIAFVLALLYMVAARVVDRIVSNGPNGFFSGTDGLLLAQITAAFMGFGAIVALFVWFVIGEPDQI